MDGRPLTAVAEQVSGAGRRWVVADRNKIQRLVAGFDTTTKYGIMWV